MNQKALLTYKYNWPVLKWYLVKGELGREEGKDALISKDEDVEWWGEEKRKKCFLLLVLVLREMHFYKLIFKEGSLGKLEVKRWTGKRWLWAWRSLMLNQDSIVICKIRSTQVHVYLVSINAVEKGKDDQVDDERLTS